MFAGEHRGDDAARWFAGDRPFAAVHAVVPRAATHPLSGSPPDGEVRGLDLVDLGGCRSPTILR